MRTFLKKKVQPKKINDLKQNKIKAKINSIRRKSTINLSSTKPMRTLSNTKPILKAQADPKSQKLKQIQTD
jgi:hypothetical protein